MKNKFLLLGLLLSVIATFSQTYARELTSSDVFNCCDSSSSIDSCSFYDCAVNKHWDNAITSISSGAFLGYSNLKKINFMGCDIVDIKDGDFVGLSDLTELNFSLNKITSIESGDFKGLSKLTTLNLGGNNITTIKKSDFSLLPKLTTLNLAGNPLISIESGTFESIPFLSSLSIINSCTTSQFNFSFSNSYCSDGVSTDQTTCENKFVCTDGVSTNQTACESAFVCTDGSTVFPGLTNQTACENAGTCSDGVSTNQTDCENGGTCDDGVSTNQTDCENAGYMWNTNFRMGGYMRTNATRQNAGYTRKTNNIQASSDNNSCSVINSANKTDFISALLDRSYSTGGGLLGLGTNYYIGNYPISFNAGVTNQILVNTVMKDSDSSSVEVQYDEGTAITTSGKSFTGVLQEPVLFDTGLVKLLNNVVSLTKFGDNFERLDFSKPVTVRLPAPGKTIGESVKIYYSQGLSSWAFHTNTTVINIGGSPYVQFTTNHATYFTIGDDTGLFTINNDASTTTSQNVTLNINAPGAIYVRFSNTSGSDRSAWESYSTSKSWTLSAGAGTKTVYVEFDTNGDNIADASSSDSIQVSNLLPGQVEGNLYLQILTGASECVYGTSLFLGKQDIKLNEAYAFSGGFTGQWYCADYQGLSGWAFTIQTSDLTNANNNVISGTNVLISHGTPVVSGDVSCTGYNGTSTSFFGAPLPLMYKSEVPNNDKICKVSLSDVRLTVNVPANQAPGSYIGTLTINIPNF